MHKIKVTFRKIDKEQEARLSKLVPKLLPLLPWWAKSLTIAIGEGTCLKEPLWNVSQIDLINVSVS